MRLLFRQNVDPYGNESLVIPSTKCTYFSSIDYAGSIPAAMNASLNSALPYVIQGVETFLHKRSAAPQIRFPASGVNLEVSSKEDFASPSGNAGQMKVWDLTDVDKERVFIDDSFEPAESEYRSAFFVRLSPTDPLKTPVPPSSKRLPLPESWSTNEDTSKTDTQVTRMKSTGSLRSMADTPAEPVSGNPSSGHRIPHSTSEASVRSTFSQSSNATLLPGVIGGTSSAPRRLPTEDMLVAEIIVDTKSFPAGYNVSSLVKSPSSSSPSGPTPDDVGSSLPLQLDGLISYQSLPLLISVSSLPPSVLHSASLSTSPPRRRHLIRLTLPTGQYSLPPVKDPLRGGDQRTTPPLPDWYRKLEESGLAVLVSLDPLAGQPYDDDGEVLVTVNGSVIVVSGAPHLTTGGKSTLSRQDKSEAYDDVASHWPHLTRYVLPWHSPYLTTT